MRTQNCLTGTVGGKMLQHQDLQWHKRLLIFFTLYITFIATKSINFHLQFVTKFFNTGFLNRFLENFLKIYKHLNEKMCM